MLRRPSSRRIAAAGTSRTPSLPVTRTGDLRAAGAAPAEALNGGYHLAYAVAAVLVLAAIAVAATLMRPPRAAAGAAAAAPARHGAEPAYCDAA